jgi:hypothetical protein
MPSRGLFRFDTPATAAAWRAIDDRVMGGVSRSRLRHDAGGHAVFEGELSLAQGGGFASVRAPVSPPLASDASAVVIEAWGDGQAYKLSLFMDEAFDAPAYQAMFTPPAGRWQAVDLPLAGFVPRWRGRAVAGAPALDITRLRQVGLMIAERQAGAFQLRLRSIALR